MDVDNFRYATNVNYTLLTQVEEFMDGAFQDVSGLTIKTGFGPADGPSDSVVLDDATWHTDSATTPPRYLAVTHIGPQGDFQLSVGSWMHYVEVDGELYEAGLIEIY